MKTNMEFVGTDTVLASYFINNPKKDSVTLVTIYKLIQVFEEEMRKKP